MAPREGKEQRQAGNREWFTSKSPTKKAKELSKHKGSFGAHSDSYRALPWQGKEQGNSHKAVAEVLEMLSTPLCC